jgi:hypothetical protein
MVVGVNLETVGDAFPVARGRVREERATDFNRGATKLQRSTSVVCQITLTDYRTCFNGMLTPSC